MSALRFSIANLLAVVTVVGVGLALLNANSGVAAGLVVLATLVALLISVLAAIYSRAETRAFWLGGVILGFTYYAVMFSTALPNAKAEIEVALRAFYFATWHQRLQSWDHAFGATLHCILTLLIALLGGVVGRFLYALNRRNESTRINEH